MEPQTSITPADAPTSLPSVGLRPVWSRAVEALVLVGLTALLLAVLPGAGALLWLVLMVVCLPLGRDLGARIAMVVVLVAGTSAICVVFLGLPPDGTTAAALASGGLGVLLVGRSLRGHSLWNSRPRVGVADATVVIGALVVGGWVGAPYIAQSAEKVLSGMFIGWDHSSHFPLFANIYDYQSLDYAAADGGLAMFEAYPPLHAVLWSLAAHVQAGPDLDRSALLPWYVGGSVVMTAVSCLLLAQVAQDFARRWVEEPRGFWRQMVMPVSVVIALLLGPTTLYFNLAHVNFLFGFALMIACGWLAVSDPDRTFRNAALMLFLGLPALLTIWPPLVLGLLPAGAAVVVPVIRRSWLLAVALVIGLGVASLGLFAAAGFDPASIWDEIVALSGQSGGLPAANVQMALMALPLFAGAGTVLAVERGWLEGLGFAWPPLGLLGFSAMVFVAAWPNPAPWGTSYFLVKPMGAVAAWAGVVVVAAVSAWFVAFLSREHRLGRPAWQGAAITVAACMVFFAGLLGSFGYVGPRTAVLPAGTPVAPGYGGLVDRVSGVRIVQEGQIVARAAGAVAAGGEDFNTMTVLWDGGDLKNNRWLRSLFGAESLEEDALLSRMPSPYAQFGDESAAQLVEWLRTNPDRAVEILIFQAASRDLLGTVAAQFPGRVTITQM